MRSRALAVHACPRGARGRDRDGSCSRPLGGSAVKWTNVVWPIKSRPTDKQINTHYSFIGIDKRLNNFAAPAPASDDVSVEDEEVFYVRGMPRKLPLKRHHWPARGDASIQWLIYRYPKRLIACTSDLHHSTQRPEHCEI